MELLAIVKALERCAHMEIKDIEIKTDSKYVADGMNNWLQGWIAKGWKTSTGKPVKNRDLWERLHTLTSCEGVHVSFSHVKAHADDEMNNMVDSLARDAALNKVCPEEHEGTEGA